MPQPTPIAVSSWVTAVTLSAVVVASPVVQSRPTCESATTVITTITTAVAGTVYFSNVRIA